MIDLFLTSPLPCPCAESDPTPPTDSTMSSPISPVGRKASVSVSIEEPTKAVDSPSSRSIPAASSVKIDPKAIEAQLLASIPEKERAIVQGWKVKQCVITRLDQGQGAAPAIPGMNVAPSAASPPMLGRLKKMGTSKMHRFTPVVTLEQSIAWLSEYGNADSSVLFENNCCFLFERGVFEEFEDIRDEDE